LAVPILTRQRAGELDRRAETEYGVPGIVLMENAGRGTTDVLRQLGVRGPIVICCGQGNNGGDGFVIARHLDLRGIAVKVLSWGDASRRPPDAKANFEIIQRAGFPLIECNASTDVASALAGAEWIVDALLGTGARGEVRPPLDMVIPLLNAAGAPILAVDLPSGLDCDTGQPAKHTIHAKLTCTFVAQKAGFLAPGAERYTGQIHVVDIGAPRRLVEEMLAAKT
jgi:NAD(P)H-hydrate epimerase